MTATGARSWVYRFMTGGRTREMGLGGFPDVKLTEARAAAEACRKERLAGNDPIEC